MANNYYLHHDLTLGFDSNPMKLSDNEINESINDLFLNKYSIDTKYIKYSSKVKTSLDIFKRKSKVSLGFKLNYYTELSEKSNYGLYFNFDQPLGRFQNLKFTYSHIPDIFLRQFDDADLVHQFLNNITPVEKAEKCYFNLSKATLTYEFPYINRKNKAQLSFFNETHYYNKHFTEFDLDIKGYKIVWKGKIKNNKYGMSLMSNDADNITFLDGNISTIQMDRSYTERGCKITFDKKFKKFSVELSADNKKRNYSSSLVGDELHYRRNHKDETISVSLKFKINDLNQKIKISSRKRETESPESWVESLKTFERYDLSYTIYFKKILLGKNK